MKVFSIFVLSVTLITSQSIYACGTPQNWMDAYEGIKGNSEWRNSTSQLGALVMLRECGTSYLHKEDDQKRLIRVLTDAMYNKNKLIRLKPTNRDISQQVRPYYRNPVAFDNLVESVYRRFDCLYKVKAKNTLKIKTKNKSIYEYFGSNSCPGGNKITITVKASNGGRLRSSPGGSVINSLRDGTELSVIKKEGDWYRVVNPVNNGSMASNIGYIHQSIVK